MLQDKGYQEQDIFEILTSDLVGWVLFLWNVDSWEIDFTALE